MVFADVGDRVWLTLDEFGGGRDFVVSGPFAGPLRAETDNLVTHARDRFLERFGGADRSIRLELEKSLPIAAGLGGGSSDAAATLNLMAEAWELDALESSEAGGLGDIARGLGADVAACLATTAVLATGRGDVLRPLDGFPWLDAVLVNPLRPSPTAAVYRAFDRGLPAPLPNSRAMEVGSDGGWGSANAVIVALEDTRNDLEGPAIRLEPAIGEVLDVLRLSRDTRLARMSGSGATCFGLCDDAEAAARLASEVARRRPDWWVSPCRLGTQPHKKADP